VKPHLFHPEADAEYADSALYYAEHGEDLGGRFYDEIERVIAEIAAAPHRFRQYDPPARRNLARDFPYAVVYLDEPDRIWIVAVMPLRRAPDYWKHRLDAPH
jgi:plasmid stabilization system protein ParE